VVLLKSPKVASTRLSLPVGVSGLEPALAEVGTLAFATNTDKVRVKLSTGWSDVGGSGGGVTSVIAGYGGVEVTNPTGPVVTVGTMIPASTYLTRPTTPDVFNDEFDTGGSADLTTRGWTVYNTVAGSLCTRAGDIRPYDYKYFSGGGTQISATQYRSRLENGRMVLQFCQSTGLGVTYLIYKAVTLPVTSALYGGLVWSRFSLPGSWPASSWAGCGFFGTTGGGTPRATTVRSVIARQGGPAGQTGFFSEVAGIGTVSQAIGYSPAYDIAGVTASATANSFAFLIDPISGSDQSSPANTTTSTPACSVLAYAGVVVNIQNNMRDMSNLMYLDFIRLRTGDLSSVIPTQWIWP
jgi:hypothetical protein